MLVLGVFLVECILPVVADELLHVGVIETMDKLGPASTNVMTHTIVSVTLALDYVSNHPFTYFCNLF